MLHTTKGAFIQSLRDIKFLKEKVEQEKLILSRYEYLRYGKMRSPLDYDITGYKNKETVRELKVGGAPLSIDEKYSINETLEANIRKCIEKINIYNLVITNAYDDLDKISEPLKSILKTRYIEQKKLRYVCKKFPELYLDSSGMYKYIMRELDKYFN